MNLFIYLFILISYSVFASVMELGEKLISQPEANTHSRKLIIDKKIFFSNNIDSFFTQNQIDIGKTNWKMISDKCISVTDQFESNKCKLEQGLNYYTFDVDKQYCIKLTKTNDTNQYYYLIKNNNNESNPIFSNEENLTTNSIINDIDISESEQCLKKLGWIDPSDYSKGTMFPLYEIKDSKYIEIK